MSPKGGGLVFKRVYYAVAATFLLAAESFEAQRATAPLRARLGVALPRILPLVLLTVALLAGGFAPISAASRRASLHSRPRGTGGHRAAPPSRLCGARDGTARRRRASSASRSRPPRG